MSNQSTEENNQKSPFRKELPQDWLLAGKMKNLAKGKRAMDVGGQVFHKCHR